jgi:hypothetical protein
MAILALLERDNLFTVGDEFQSIYAFRHADVEIFRERFATLYERQSARVLSENFRSRAPVLDAINAVFAPHFGAGFVPLRAGRSDAEAGRPTRNCSEPSLRRRHCGDVPKPACSRRGLVSLSRAAKRRPMKSSCSCAPRATSRSMSRRSPTSGS